MGPSFYFGSSIISHATKLIFFVRTMTTVPKLKDSWTYAESVSVLNSLQSNASTIKKIEERIRRREDCMNFKETWKYLNRIGINEDTLKKLSVVHVTGTKGKGTTSAMCESILRHHGYRTGLYTSPHLVMVAERIQIDGKQLPKDEFAHHFSRVFKVLQEKQEHDGDMPPYFMFLTVLAFDVFLRKKVDVAVVEVGIGGEYDITNVVNNVITAGIATLGLEHTEILGNTIEHIAREKGGILKSGCVGHTVAQSPSVLNVLRNIALTRNCTLDIVPEYDSYVWESGEAPKLIADIPAYKSNASLAIQLAHSWMSHSKIPPKTDTVFENLKQYLSKESIMTDNKSEESNNYDNKNLIEKFVNVDYCIRKIPRLTSEAISKCVWPGRCQIFQSQLAEFYIDGAHTVESINVCASWFASQKRSSSNRVLVFNVTGGRNSEPMLKILHALGFHYAIFTSNIAYRSRQCVDQVSLVTSKGDTEALSRKNLEIWNGFSKLSDDESVETVALTVSCVEDAFNHIEKISNNTGEKPQVLVTGSLHLAGAVLTVLTNS